MSMPLVQSPALAYATKVNVKFPGTQAQATALEAAAVTRFADGAPTGVALTVAAGTIKLAA